MQYTIMSILIQVLKIEIQRWEQCSLEAPRAPSFEAQISSDNPHFTPRVYRTKMAVLKIDEAQSMYPS